MEEMALRAKLYVLELVGAKVRSNLVTNNSYGISSKRSSISILVEHLLNQKWKIQAANACSGEPMTLVNWVSTFPRWLILT
jgi:hypothetical protein